MLNRQERKRRRKKGLEEAEKSRRLRKGGEMKGQRSPCLRGDIITGCVCGGAKKAILQLECSINT